jgi:hypothetical protein
MLVVVKHLELSWLTIGLNFLVSSLQSPLGVKGMSPTSALIIAPERY